MERKSGPENVLTDAVARGPGAGPGELAEHVTGKHALLEQDAQPSGLIAPRLAALLADLVEHLLRGMAEGVEGVVQQRRGDQNAAGLIPEPERAGVRRPDLLLDLCTCRGPDPGRTCAQAARGQGAAAPLRRGRPDPTTGRITAATMANPPGIHRT